MQQGMLSSLLLSSSLLFGAMTASATEMDVAQSQYWLQDQQIQTKVSEFIDYIHYDEVDSLSFSLQRLTFPQQEVARFLLLQTLEQEQAVLTPKLVAFLRKQQQIVPTYQTIRQGDGYELTAPTFDYPAIVNRLLMRWEQDQKILAFILRAERKELVLQTWLTGSEQERQAKETLLLAELDSLSLEAVLHLCAQLTQATVTSWLPSSEVVVRLAQVSEDSETYKMLWRMRADQYSQAELNRLAGLNTPFAMQQMMGAAQNPSLKSQALTLLTQVKPLPEEVKDFLITRMAITEEAPMVARELVKQGHRHWLQDLVSTNQQVSVSSLQQVLGQ
ncbi:hypothetical protein BCU68_07455 [Vibrio sp. 10N.286.49.B3]|uniref:hypothetical protein n=1 Tax=Vibrio sp. 10N.286.49.B3 TaxID=1880855 RepID=UPI000C84D1CD|nr:hypothetical protein [Vibrio sp. 10N.286.49.B3]PMH38660.1 hypothetical protein BCU68_07455 [Vibrio sp. 10N.286.49.B3]